MDIREYKYEKDDIIFNIKDDTCCFYYIQQGKVELYHNGKYGDVIEKTCFVGHVFGYEDYFAGSLRTKKAIAKETVIVIQLNKDNLLDFVSWNPSEGPKIKKQLMTNQTTEEIADPLLKPFDEKHKDYLFPKDVQCPVCQERFKVNQIRYAKLMLKKLEDDFRSVFYDFDDLWYQIWRCPCCQYINFYDKFYEVDFKTEKMLQVSLPRQHNTQITHVKENLSQVLEDYSEIAKYTKIYKMKPMTIARIYQSVAWILEDLHDDETVNIEYNKLMETLVDAWNNTTPLQTDIELKLAYKVALLHEKNGDLEKAIKFLYKASETKKAKIVLKKRVQDKLYDLRARYKEIQQEKKENSEKEKNYR